MRGARQKGRPKKTRKEPVLDKDINDLHLKLNDIIKVKCAILLLEFRRGAHLPSEGHEPVGGNTTIVCDTWPAQYQTYGYLPSSKVSPPLGRNQTILHGNKGTVGTHKTTFTGGYIKLQKVQLMLIAPNHYTIEVHYCAAHLIGGSIKR